MLTKALSAAVLGLSLAAVPALAQTTPGGGTATTPAPASQANTNQSEQPHQTASQMDLWPASKIIGLNVYNEKSEKIGGINNLMMSKDGKIDTVVIGVGGFLGIGEHDVAVKFTDLKWEMEPVKTTTSSAAPAGGGMAGGAGMSRPSGTVGAAGSSSTASSSQSQFWPDHAILANATKDQLKNMPQFDATK
jgi:hypothetical protein